jgi:hypothetical protein
MMSGSLAAFVRRCFNGAAKEPPSLAAACSLETEGGMIGHSPSGPFPVTDSAAIFMAAVPDALADASAPVATPTAPAVFVTVAACPRNDAMSAGSATAFFASVAFFASAALVGASPRAGAGFFRTFCLALQKTVVGSQVFHQITTRP